MLNTENDSLSLLRFVVAAGTVIGLLALLAYILKYVAARGWIKPAAGVRRRLKLIETLPLDARRRLVIIQCDDAQHLLLLGMNQDMVVAQNLAVTPAATPEPPLAIP